MGSKRASLISTGCASTRTLNHVISSQLSPLGGTTVSGDETANELVYEARDHRPTVMYIEYTRALDTWLGPTRSTSAEQTVKWRVSPLPLGKLCKPIYVDESGPWYLSGHNVLYTYAFVYILSINKSIDDQYLNILHETSSAAGHKNLVKSIIMNIGALMAQINVQRQSGRK